MTHSEPSEHITSPPFWQKISVTVDARQSEEAATLLASMSGNGVEIDDTSPESSMITGYLDPSVTPGESEEFLADLSDRMRRLDPRCSISRAALQEQDWNREWKKHFHALSLSPRLTVCPSWEAKTLSGHGQTLIMDPGMAFGTGHHATTALVVGLLDQLMAGDATRTQTVLDVGCGTGILAMAAALFGATTVLAVDNDPEAVRVAGETVRSNQLEQTVTVADTPLAAISGPYDLVCANIIFSVLHGMLPEFARLIPPGGHLILSGLLAGEQTDRIARAALPLHFTLEKTDTREEWAALLFLRTAAAQ